ncbi:NlpC/P60 family protein [Kutzneria viridogrisea]|uniref:NlpC/P60 domain-containing protein n=2 Tax=Kutzneria TaxID=43356 RepID=W5WM64_9PSEU|nr:C40 family peptidase [Kutzneria albida]AHI01963.1 hypothetical protein KALB_8606 [Kutzneria albida DSM 43870]MBA8929614.1 cell wall-associated NlpC family hydrolase [Kutzneria viridogrisea]
MNSFKRVLCGVGVAAAVVGLTPTSAVADPPADALAQLQAASRAQEEVSEKFNVAQEDLKAKRAEVGQAGAELDRAKQALSAAQAEQGKFREQVDGFISATAQGAQLNSMSALLTGQSPSDFLDRSWLLEQLSTRNREAMDKLGAALDKAGEADHRAADARRRADEAAAKAQQLSDELGQRKADAEKAQREAQAAYSRLSPTQKTVLRSDRGDSVGSLQVPAGTAGNAVRAALGEVGVPYVYGGTTPSGFDCSGLVQWAYRQAGVSITRITTTQYNEGAPVARADLRPGDLVFYGTASNIHHVSMYIGDGKVVHAPDVGEVVKVVPIERSGNDYFGAKRIVSG